MYPDHLLHISFIFYCGLWLVGCLFWHLAAARGASGYLFLTEALLAMVGVISGPQHLIGDLYWCQLLTRDFKKPVKKHTSSSGPVVTLCINSYFLCVGIISICNKMSVSFGANCASFCSVTYYVCSYNHVIACITTLHMSYNYVYVAIDTCIHI